MKGESLRIEVAFGPDAGRTVTSDADEVTVGTSSSSTLVLHDSLVASNHLRIVYSKDGFVLHDCSGKDDVNVDGQPAREARLASFTFIELGGTTLRLEKQGGGFISPKNAKVLSPAPGSPGIRFPALARVLANLPESLEGQAKLMIGDNLLLLIGGQQVMYRNRTNAVLLVDLRSGQVHTLPPLPEPRSYAMATQLADGRILVTGGGSRTTLLLDPQTWTWSTSGPLGVDRNGGVLLPLTDGRAFAVGGFFNAQPRVSGEVWDSVRNAWMPMPPGKSHLLVDAIQLSPQKALLLSRADSKAEPTPFLVDLERLTFAPLNPLPQGLGRILLAALPGERALLLPTAGGDPERRTAYHVDPAANSGQFITPRLFVRLGGAAVGRPDGSVLVMGGESSSSGLYVAEMYHPHTNAWKALPPPREGTGGAQLFARRDGSVVVVGSADVRIFPAEQLR